MSLTIPSRDLNNEQKLQLRDICLRMAVDRARGLGLGRTEKELTIRDLLAADLGLPNWSLHPWSQPQHTWGNPSVWISLQNGMKTIGIFKCLQLGYHPTAKELRFGKGSVIMGIHSLESAYAGLPILESLREVFMDPEAREVLHRMTGNLDNNVNPALGTPMEAYFSDPYFYDPQDAIRISTDWTNGDDYLVLGGYVVERRGSTVV